jgi:hypothetical protein
MEAGVLKRNLILHQNPGARFAEISGRYTGPYQKRRMFFPAEIAQGDGFPPLLTTMGKQEEEPETAWISVLDRAYSMFLTGSRLSMQRVYFTKAVISGGTGP